ncbi:hypothetical protein M8J75_015217 [Diaphorina citri]|nr:hypothetical protein M8J75_015217 [Diaphorina citri]
MTQPTTSTGRRYRNGESRMDPRYFRPTYRYVNDSDDETYDSQKHHNHSAESIFLPEDDDPDESINISIPQPIASEASGTRRTNHRRNTTRPETSQRSGLDVSSRRPTASATSTLSTTSSQRSSQRMHWTRDMNIQLIHEYYVATELETKKTNYMSDVTRIWNQRYPEFQLNNSRLNSQMNSLFRRNVFSRIELNKMKEDAAKTLKQNDDYANDETVDDPDIVHPVQQLENKITRIRQDIGILTQYFRNPNKSRHPVNQWRHLQCSENIH